LILKSYPTENSAPPSIEAKLKTVYGEDKKDPKIIYMVDQGLVSGLAKVTSESEWLSN